MDPLPGDDPSQVAGGHDQHTCTWQGAHGANTWRLGGTMHSIVVLSLDPSMRFTVNAGGGIDTDNLSFSMGIPIDGHLALEAIKGCKNKGLDETVTKAEELQKCISWHQWRS